jgi:hypothetical protein
MQHFIHQWLNSDNTLYEVSQMKVQTYATLDAELKKWVRDNLLTPRTYIANKEPLSIKEIIAKRPYTYADWKEDYEYIVKSLDNYSTKEMRADKKEMVRDYPSYYEQY